MATEINLPNLGDGIDSGEVLEVFVSAGDAVEEGQSLMEIETDKATVNVPCSTGGVVSEILVGEGDTVAIGQPIVKVEAGSAAPSANETQQEAPAEVTPQPAKELVAAVAPAAPSPAVVAPEPTPTRAPSAPSQKPGWALPAGPAIRRFAREVGVDLSVVTPTGAGGRIIRDDILSVVRSGSRVSSETASSPRPDSLALDAKEDTFGPVEVKKLSKIRKTIAKKMHESWTTAPRVTNFDDADVTDLEQFRKSSKDEYAEQGIKLTSMPFVIKAVAMALRNNPAINASIDMDAGTLVYKKYVNIGIAVDTDRGLVVPSLRNADKLSIPDIARELSTIASNARENNFSVNDLRGSTFTISNLGAIGGTYSTPIINVPEAAILLLGRTRKLPTVIGDEIKPRLMMPLSISYDHRLIDGAMAARFLNDVIGYLKAPSRLLLAL